MPKLKPKTRAALSKREQAPPASGNGRSAGPRAMRDLSVDWDKVDEAIDESFPCSDPPCWPAGGHHTYAARQEAVNGGPPASRAKPSAPQSKKRTSR
jgi:hypothetical protein